MTLLCLASSTTPRRPNLLTALAQCTVSHFRSSSKKVVVVVLKFPNNLFMDNIYAVYCAVKLVLLRKGRVVCDIFKETVLFLK